MGKMKVSKAGWRTAIDIETNRWQECRVRIISLESGETVKRGCGRKGMIPTDVGWHCFYCGNYIYQTKPSLKALWFHFRIAREYWRAMSRGENNFINGVLVSGLPDFLPRRLLADLSEANPPKWFLYYLTFDEEQFQTYLKTQGR